MAEDSSDSQASWASHIHEERVGVLYKALKLVLLGLLLGVNMKAIELHIANRYPDSNVGLYIYRFE